MASHMISHLRKQVSLPQKSRQECFPQSPQELLPSADPVSLTPRPLASRGAVMRLEQKQTKTLKFITVNPVQLTLAMNR